MKKIMLFLSAAVLLLCATTCDSEEKNKGRFAKNIPVCIKERIKDDGWIVRADEYCSTDDAKKIYNFVHCPFPFLDTMMFWYDENCNFFLVQSEEYPVRVFNPDDWVWGFLLPDKTIEYKEDIYHFKRIVFTQKK